MIMKTNLSVKDAEIVFPEKKVAPSLLSIEPNNPDDGGFIFYSKADPTKWICKVAYTEKRGKCELYYETAPTYRNQVHMTAAMSCVLEWMKKYSVKSPLWLLINENNTASQRIAKKYNFNPMGEFISDSEWYCLNL